MKQNESNLNINHFRQPKPSKKNKVTPKTLLKSVSFYQKITSSTVYFSGTIITAYLLNVSLTNGIYEMMESFGQAGYLLSMGLFLLIMFANYVSSICVVETVGRVEVKIKREEVFSGGLILKDNLFLDMGKKTKKELSGEEREEEISKEELEALDKGNEQFRSFTETEKQMKNSLISQNELKEKLLLKQKIDEEFNQADNLPVILDERRIEFSQMIKKLFNQKIVWFYQILSIFTIAWYIGMLIYWAAEQTKDFFNIDIFEKKDNGLDFDDTILSAVLGLIIFIFCLLPNNNLVKVQSFIVIIKVVMIIILGAVLIVDYLDFKISGDTVTRKVRERGDLLSYDLKKLYIPTSWAYSLMNVNYFVPGAIANLSNRNNDYIKVIRSYNWLLILIIIPTGIFTSLNFGNASIVLYEYYTSFDAGFHEVSPLWAYITSRILGITPVVLILLSGPSFINNATANLVSMINPKVGIEHFSFLKIVTYRLFISIIILVVSVTVQYMEPGVYISICGVVFCLTCGIFPILMHMKAKSQVKKPMENQSVLSSFAPIALLIHLVLFLSMIGYFYLEKNEK